MTTMAERPRGSDEPGRDTDLPLATVPWPFVERRRASRSHQDGSVPRPPVPAQRTSGAPAATSTEQSRSRGRAGSWSRWVLAAVLGADLLAGTAAALGAYHLRFHEDPGGAAYLVSVAVAPVVWVGAVALTRGYERRWFGSGADEFRCVLRAGALVTIGTATLSYALRAELARGFLLAASLLVVLASLAGRLACRAALNAARRRGRAMLDVVLVGHEAALLDLVHQVVRERSVGLHLVGACVPGGSSPRLEALGVPVLGDLHQAAAVVRRADVDTVAVTAGPELGGPALRRLAWDLEGTGVDLVVSPGLIEVAGPRLHIRPLCGLPLLHVEQPELSGFRHLVKAALDRVGSLLALLVLSPVLLGVAVLVRASTRGPVLFSQLRVGRDGRHFRIWKFRTMHLDAESCRPDVEAANVHGDEVLFKIPRDPRVTPVGRWLRRFSLDELPQLVNVLLGHMSLVGPRPPLPSEVARYGDGVHRRLLVKPGLTGLWQIRGRSDLSWDESIRLDLRYVENWSLAMDLMIIWKTFAAVLGGRGAY